jgi:hypothetical protein
LSDKDKKAAQDHYNAAYADAILRGQDSETASRTAYDSMVERFRLDKDVGITRFDPRVGGSESSSGNNNGSGTGKNFYFKFIDSKTEKTIVTKTKWYKYGTNILYTFGWDFAPSGYTVSTGSPISVDNFNAKSPNSMTFYCTKKETSTNE